MKIIELQYLPQPLYFALLLQEPALKIEAHEHFVKQTYRNRCRILTANGVDDLSIPVIGAGKKILIKDIKIDYKQKWLNRHWRAILSAYGKAPFFEYYADDFFSTYRKKHKFLFDLSYELLTQCLDFLQFDIAINFTNSYQALSNSPKNDLRSKISPKVNPNYLGAYKQVTYQQVFGNNFVDNLSVIDLIFCEGPRAGELLKSGINKGTH
jgi:WbqC-like protein